MSDDDWYTDDERIAIEAADRTTRVSLQRLRDYDARAREWREPHVAWDAVSAGRGPDYTEGDPS